MRSLYVSCSLSILHPSLLAAASMFLLFELTSANAVVMPWVFIHLKAFVIMVVAMPFLLASGSTPVISICASLTLFFLL